MVRPGARWVVLAIVGLGVHPAAEAQVVRTVTDPRDDLVHHADAAMDDAGSVVYFSSSANPFGSNPTFAPQIVRCDLPAATCSAVTSFRNGVYGAVSVSDDGAWLSFVSSSNPLGLNHDQSLELFVMRPDGIDLAQLTNQATSRTGRVTATTLSGSANRLLFLSTIDLLGTNVANETQLYAIDRDGSSLTQLSSVSGGRFSGFSISDDGNRVVFSYGDGPVWDPNDVIYAVEGDGSNFRALTSDLDNAADPVISGDGTAIAFSAESVSGNVFVSTMAWDGTLPTWSTLGSDPSIRDNGKVVYFSRPDGEIWSVSPTTLVEANLTGNTGSIENGAPVVSGNGSRVVFQASGGEYSPGSNPDLGVELLSIASSGGTVQQLTLNGPAAFDSEPHITSDGTRITFPSIRPTTVDGSEIYRIDADGSDLFQVTQNFAFDANYVSASDDGRIIAFQHPDPSFSHQEIHRVLDDGTGLIPLTPGSVPSSRHPVISADGSRIVYQAGGGHTVNRIAPDGSDFAEVVYMPGYEPKYSRMTATGDWIVFTDSTGAPQEVYRIRDDGTGLESITPYPCPAAHLFCSNRYADITSNGDAIVYSSDADPLGTNPDYNSEIFHYVPATGVRTQFTSTAGGTSRDPRISGNGDYIYFYSNAPFFEPVVGEPYELYRITVATGAIQRSGGLRDAGIESPPTLYTNMRYAVDEDGDRAVFSGGGNPSGDNPDLTPEIWIVDWSAPARISPGRESPTIVTWDAEPSAVRYDVIRGEVGNLSINAGTVDLGPVVCVEDDSPDTSTAGYEDLAQPAPGELFFYVYRGTQGLLDGPGSYGWASAGFERAAVGGCAD